MSRSCVPKMKSIQRIRTYTRYGTLAHRKSTWECSSFHLCCHFRWFSVRAAHERIAFFRLFVWVVSVLARMLLCVCTGTHIHAHVCMCIIFLYRWITNSTIQVLHISVSFVGWSFRWVDSTQNPQVKSHYGISCSFVVQFWCKFFTNWFLPPV